MRMSGVLTKKFGRKYCSSPEVASSPMYSLSSQWLLFQVKYV